MRLGQKKAIRFSSNCYTCVRAQVLQKQMDLELELVSDKAEKYGGHSVVLARVSVVALSSQPVDQDKRLMNDPNERLCPEYSDEEEEFSSEGEAEGSDSEPTLEMGHRRKTRAKIPPNARVRELNYISNLCIMLFVYDECIINMYVVCHANFIGLNGKFRFYGRTRGYVLSFTCVVFDECVHQFLSMLHQFLSDQCGLALFW